MFLSVFQALTISPRKSCWKDHKVKVEKNIGCHISLIWILYIMINFISFAYTFVNRDSTNISWRRDTGYCSIVGWNEIGSSLYASLVVCPEIFLSVLMAWSSASTIVILYRHKQRIQHIQRNNGPGRNSTESIVTQSILILVSTFLAFYTLSSILRGYVTLLYNHNWWLVNIDRLISLCFPSFFPIVLMNHYPKASKICLVWIRTHTI